MSRVATTTLPTVLRMGVDATIAGRARHLTRAGGVTRVARLDTLRTIVLLIPGKDVRTGKIGDCHVVERDGRCSYRHRRIAGDYDCLAPQAVLSAQKLCNTNLIINHPNIGLSMCLPQNFTTYKNGVRCGIYNNKPK